MIQPSSPEWFYDLLFHSTEEMDVITEAFVQRVWERLLERGTMTEDPFFFRIIFHLDLGKTPEGWWDDVDAEQDARRGYVDRSRENT